MQPELTNFLHIGSYSFFMLVALATAYGVSRIRAGRFGILPSHIDNVAILVPLCGLWAARVSNRYFYHDMSLAQALEVWKGGGLVLYGGLIGGFLSLWLYAKLRTVSLLALADVIAPGVAFALSLGRVGCFLAGCCWGDVCAERAELASVLNDDQLYQVQTVRQVSIPNWPLAVRFPPKSSAYQQHLKLGLITSDASASMPVHPVQLYEAFLAAALGVLLLGHRRKFPGSTAVLCVLGYAAIRFGMEILRADNAPEYFGLTLSQFVSVFLAALACGCWLRCKREVAADNTVSPPGREQPIGVIH